MLSKLFTSKRSSSCACFFSFGCGKLSKFKSDFHRRKIMKNQSIPSKIYEKIVFWSETRSPCCSGLEEGRAQRTAERQARAAALEDKRRPSAAGAVAKANQKLSGLGVTESARARVHLLSLVYLRVLYLLFHVLNCLRGH